jgi:hypothetical protein
MKTQTKKPQTKMIEASKGIIVTVIGDNKSYHLHSKELLHALKFYIKYSALSTIIVKDLPKREVES